MNCEQQEWTGKTVADIAFPGGHHITPVLRERIADAHNAALTAARLTGWHECNAEDLRKFEQFDKQLTAERQRREQAEEQLRNLTESHIIQKKIDDDKLLSALAAIQDIRDHVKGYGERPPALFRVEEMCNAVDLSPLREHDAEVRKPLVDALSDCAHLLAQEHIQHHGNCGGIDCPVFKASRKGFDALAKVKP